jgi:hypothetical protein
VIPLQYKLIAGALAVLILLGAVTGFVHHERSLGAEKAHAAQLVQDLAAERAARVESDRRTAAIQEKAHAADLAASAARADAADAHDAADRLRQRIATLSRRPTGNPATAAASAAAGAPIDLRDDVLSRLLDVAGQLGAFADQSRVAGLACEHSYDALTAR